MAKTQIDEAAVKRIAHLARLKISGQEVQSFQRELNGILAFVEELNAIDTGKVEPLTHAGDAKLRMRTDIVTDGAKPADIVKNAPMSEDGFFLVPKVIE
jgi:aspartyl-tRNA(Asn)/glutamyl-tRNA(Gln) amidotransferase subunit C